MLISSSLNRQLGPPQILIFKFGYFYNCVAHYADFISRTGNGRTGEIRGILKILFLLHTTLSQDQLFTILEIPNLNEFHIQRINSYLQKH